MDDRRPLQFAGAAWIFHKYDSEKIGRRVGRKLQNIALNFFALPQRSSARDINGLETRFAPEIAREENQIGVRHRRDGGLFDAARLTTPETFACSTIQRVEISFGPGEHDPEIRRLIKANFGI